MDNITKRTKFELFNNAAKVASIGIPCLADVLGIISFFIPNLNKFIQEISSIPFFIGVNIILVVGIIYIIEGSRAKRAVKTKDFIEGYNELLEEYSGYLEDFDKKASQITDTDKLYDMSAEGLKAIVDRTKIILCNVTGKKIRVCIKAFPYDEKQDAYNSKELITFCRSDQSLRKSHMERNDRIQVDGNTDFKMIMAEAYPYFAFNGLDNFDKETHTKYENTTPDWSEKYQATIVYPISKKIDRKGGKDIYTILGFLCIDTLSVDAFEQDIGVLCLPFIESVTHLLYVFLDKTLYYGAYIYHQSHQEMETASK